MRSDQEQKRRLETYRLIEAAQQGDEEARARLIRENTGLVSVSARKFSGGSYEYEDLMQIGYLGLLKAIDRFDPKFEVMFSTYAVPMIMGEIRRYLRDDGRHQDEPALKQDVRLLKAGGRDFYARQREKSANRRTGGDTGEDARKKSLKFWKRKILCAVSSVWTEKCLTTPCPLPVSLSATGMKRTVWI